MCSDWDNYVNDPRRACKYGSKCYQKNPQHHQAFKHPPIKRKNTAPLCPNKRPKPNISDDSNDPVIIDNFSPTDKTNSKDTTAISPDEDDISQDTNTSSNLKADNDVLHPDVTTEVTYYKYSQEANGLFKDLFLVDMPIDFYSFYEFLTEKSEIIEDLLRKTNLELIGPFDLLFNQLPIINDKSLYLVHWRYFFDPPEFQSIIKIRGKSEFHMGYFRDSPSEDPVFVGSNDSSKNSQITPLSGNIFGALFLHLEKEKKRSPFIAMHCQKLMALIKTWATDHNFSLEEYNTKKRIGQAVAKTFHGAGIMVPYDKKTTVGYRPLAEKDAVIRKILEDLSQAGSQREKDVALSALQPVITYANIAMDECDFGTGLELGLDLFCAGLPELDATTLATLSTAYSLLDRPQFATIIQVHLKHRRKGNSLSVKELTS